MSEARDFDREQELCAMATILGLGLKIYECGSAREPRVDADIDSGKLTYEYVVFYVDQRHQPFSSQLSPEEDKLITTFTAFYAAIEKTLMIAAKEGVES